LEKWQYKVGIVSFEIRHTIQKYLNKFILGYYITIPIQIFDNKHKVYVIMILWLICNMKQTTEVNEIEFEELATELLELNSVIAVTASEELLSHGHLLLSIHGPHFGEEKEDVSEVFQDIESIQIDGDTIEEFSYGCDPYPPNSLGNVEIYVPDEFAADDELSLNGATVAEGVRNASAALGEVSQA
jgi:hypothetical protein